jgi:arabinose-5-phosphate isomerase
MSRDLTGRAARVLSIEAEGLLALREKLDRQFTRAVEMLLRAPGKVIVTGMGKSGLIGRKIAATLASTGTPAFFLHPAEGLHGDIGMVLKGDIVIALSNSGETLEVVRLLPVFKRLGLELIALTGNPQSTLARHADAVLDVGVREGGRARGRAVRGEGVFRAGLRDAPPRRHAGPQAPHRGGADAQGRGDPPGLLRYAA